MNEDTPASARKRLKPIILHQDDLLIVVNKPAGVWPREGVFDDEGVFDMLAPDKDPDEVALTQVNAIECEVSGVAIYAAPEPADALRRQFDAGDATLVYNAIVGGPLLNESGQLPAAGESSHGTEWRVIDAYVGYTMIECVTSNLSEHQIRRDLQHAGMPLTVDSRYGGAMQLKLSSFKAGYRKSRRRPERPLMERPSVHLASASFRHPADGRELRFEAEPPKDFRALLNQLDRFGRIPK
ncbi:MAG: hypothetical protein KDA33_03285 [Phycisphaerales bacterium]|nr:hypothetical protein [Phycisphaerales bacterium]